MFTTAITTTGAVIIVGITAIITTIVTIGRRSPPTLAPIRGRLPITRRLTTLVPRGGDKKQLTTSDRSAEFRSLTAAGARFPTRIPR